MGPLGQRRTDAARNGEPGTLGAPLTQREAI